MNKVSIDKKISKKDKNKIFKGLRLSLNCFYKEFKIKLFLQKVHINNWGEMTGDLYIPKLSKENFNFNFYSDEMKLVIENNYTIDGLFSNTIFCVKNNEIHKYPQICEKIKFNIWDVVLLLREEHYNEFYEIGFRLEKDWDLIENNTDTIKVKHKKSDKIKKFKKTEDIKSLPLIE